MSKFWNTCFNTLSAPPSSATGSLFKSIEFTDTTINIMAEMIGSDRINAF